MIIYFVRHGHPDYAKDCLTPLGKAQAQAASQKLSTYGIGQIYSSTNGRAYETASYTARLTGLDIVPCNFMREISWESKDGSHITAGGHPWNLAEHFASEGIPFSNKNWRECEPWSKSVAPEKVDTVISGFDALMAELGYQREGEFYRVTGADTDNAIAIFSHGGSSSAVISHLFNIPFPQVCGFFSINYTSITCVRLPDSKGKLVAPRLVYSNDARHIEGLEVENKFE